MTLAFSPTRHWQINSRLVLTVIDMDRQIIDGDARVVRHHSSWYLLFGL